MKKSILFFIVTLSILSFANSLRAEDSKIIFIPVNQSFDFTSGSIVDHDQGDIFVAPYGVENVNAKVYIAELEKGFVEDIKTLPEDKLVEWTNYVEFIRDMIYAVKCTNKKYALFELIDIKVSQDQVIGIEIGYKYQPDGSRNFP